MSGFPPRCRSRTRKGPWWRRWRRLVGQLCSGIGRTSGVLTAKTRGPQAARARAPRAMGCFHSDTTLCKRYNTCKVWYPFENSTSLARLLPVPARRTRLPFEDSASLAKRTTQTRLEPAGTPQARVPRECRSAPRTAHAKAPAKARAPTAHTVMGPMGAQGHHHSCTAFKFCIPRSKGMACGVRPIV